MKKHKYEQNVTVDAEPYSDVHCIVCGFKKDSKYHAKTKGFMKTIKIGRGSYADLPTGSKLIIPNPKWDGDKPNTQFFMELEATEEICVELCGEYSFKVLKTNIKK